MPPSDATVAAVPGWLVGLHVLGVIVYAGGIVSVSRLVSLAACGDDGPRAALASAARRVYLGTCLPGAVAMLATGVYLLVADPGGKRYLHDPSGYFHMKLTLAVLLLGVDHAGLRLMKALARGTPGADADGRRVLLRLLHAAVIALVAGVLVALFVVKPR